MTAPRFSRRAVLGSTLVSLIALGPVALGPASAELAPPAPRRLALRAGTARLRGADKDATAVWGFDGAVPGPVLRVKRGGDVWITAANELPEPTALHWHGVRLDNRMDGVPHLTQAPIPPGGTFDYRFTCPDAGTFWVHPDAGQLGRGLAGALIVEEDEPVAVDQDLVLMLQDWSLTEAGALDPALDGPAGTGRVGPLATLNGQPAQDIHAKANDRLRLRLINAATTRIAGLAFEGGLNPVVVAIDGQPSEAFELGRPLLALPPGARVDLMVDMPAAGAEAQDTAPSIRLTGYGRDAVLARFVIDPGAPRRPEPRAKVAELPANPLPRTIELKGALRLDLPIEGAAAGALEGMDLPRRGRRGRAAAVQRAARPRRGAGAGQQDAGAARRPSPRPRRPPARQPRRRLEAVVARHLADRGQDRPRRLHCRQSGQMAGRVPRAGSAANQHGRVVRGHLTVTRSPVRRSTSSCS